MSATKARSLRRLTLRRNHQDACDLLMQAQFKHAVGDVAGSILAAAQFHLNQPQIMHQFTLESRVAGFFWWQRADLLCLVDINPAAAIEKAREVLGQEFTDELKKQLQNCYYAEAVRNAITKCYEPVFARRGGLKVRRVRTVPAVPLLWDEYMHEFRANEDDPDAGFPSYYEWLDERRNREQAEMLLAYKDQQLETQYKPAV